MSGWCAADSRHHPRGQGAPPPLLPDKNPAHTLRCGWLQAVAFVKQRCSAALEQTGCHQPFLPPYTCLQVVAFVKQHIPDSHTAQLAGNSVHVDRTFLSKCMPQLVDHLHYRIVDVSTIKELARRWFPKASRLRVVQPSRARVPPTPFMHAVRSPHMRRGDVAAAACPSDNGVVPRCCAVRCASQEYKSAPRKKLAHTALSDIQESIEELKHWRKAIFKQK